MCVLRAVPITSHSQPGGLDLSSHLTRDYSCVLLCFRAGTHTFFSTLSLAAAALAWEQHAPFPLLHTGRRTGVQSGIVRLLSVCAVGTAGSTSSCTVHLVAVCCVFSCRFWQFLLVFCLFCLGLGSFPVLGFGEHLLTIYPLATHPAWITPTEVLCDVSLHYITESDR